MKVLFAAIILLSCSSHAGYGDYSDSNLFWERNHFISLVVDSWKYEESAIEDSGLLYGAQYAYRTLISGDLYFEFNAEYLQGTTEYNGQTLGTPPVPLSFDQKNKIYKGEVWLGYQLGDSSSAHVLPKVGFMYRQLKDPNDEFAGDYRRYQQYFVIPVGADIFFPMGENKVVLSAWASLSFKGKNKTFWTDVGGATDSTYDQDKGQGYGLDLTYLAPPFNMALFYRAWKVDDSTMGLNTVPGSGTGFFLEPENKTASMGLRIGVAL